jgi:hypothetical protein
MLQPSLLSARKFLHDADLAHGHEIARGRVRVRAIHRQVVDADYQCGVG